jgi:hypothetical protein
MYCGGYWVSAAMCIPVSRLISHHHQQAQRGARNLLDTRNTQSVHILLACFSARLRMYMAASAFFGNPILNK